MCLLCERVYWILVAKIVTEKVGCDGLIDKNKITVIVPY